MRIMLLRTAAMAAVVIAVLSFTITNVGASSDYKFKVHNNTKQTIKKILASPDGKKYGQFDIGSGIKAGATVELVWDKSTDNSNCDWFFVAVFADGEESDPVEFDFCEKDLVLEFEG